MDDERQKPVTNAYRAGWERTFRGFDPEIVVDLCAAHIAPGIRCGHRLEDHEQKYGKCQLCSCKAFDVL